jgi:hypothetical protein
MALSYPDILQHNNSTKALTDIIEVRGNSYPINLLSDTGSIPVDKRKVGAIIFVSSSQDFYGFYGQTIASWDTTSNWRSLGGTLDTSSFATTGSNIFVGNQTVTGSMFVSSSVIANSFTGSLSGTATSATNASKVAVATSAGNSVFYPTFVDATSGNASVFVDTELTYNPFTNTLSATSFTGSLFGTSSWAQNVISSSYALTASYALNAGTGGTGAGFPFTGSALISGSLLVTGSVSATRGGFTGSLQGTASFATSASFATFAATASVGPGTVNYLSKFTTTTRIGDSLVYDNGTNVGIGTSGPTAKLDVSGSDAKINGLHIGRAINGSSNTRVGENTLNVIDSSATGNTAIGSFALNTNNSGSSNTAIGASTLVRNVEGSNNVAIGYNAGASNNSGIGNTFIGTNAGSQISGTGNFNIIIGNSAASKSIYITNSTIIGSATDPVGQPLSSEKGSFIAIGAGANNVQYIDTGAPKIWHQNNILIPSGSTQSVLALDGNIYSAAIIEYSLNFAQSIGDGNDIALRVGCIKFDTYLQLKDEEVDFFSKYRFFEEEVSLVVGQTHNVTWNGFQNTRQKLLLLVNSTYSDVYLNLSCRFHDQNFKT